MYPYSTLIMITYLQMGLVVLFMASIIYNFVAQEKNKQWSITIAIGVIFFFLQMYEGEIYDDMMYDQYYDDDLYREVGYSGDVIDTPGTSLGSCSSNKFDCTDFNTPEEAQIVYDACGGLTNDVHHLDRDLDGLACEWD